MSKEAMEKILRAEDEARTVIENAKRDAEKGIEDIEDKIEKERALFYEKLNAEKNERIRRVDMQMNVNAEAAKNKADKAYEEKMREYESFFDKAVSEVARLVME